MISRKNDALAFLSYIVTLFLLYKLDQLLNPILKTFLERNLSFISLVAREY